MSTEIVKANKDLNESILAMEDLIVRECEPAEIKWIHRFTPGMYAREMIVEEDTLITGVMHKTEHLSIFLEGSILVATGNGETEILHAPIIQIAQPGLKRAGIALSQVRWITVHPTDETDVAKCEKQFFTNDPREMDVLLEDHTPNHKVEEEINFGFAQRFLELTEDK